MIKKLSSLSLGLYLLALMALPANAQEPQANIYFFWGHGCPHCALEKRYLDNLARNNPQVNVYEYEVWDNEANFELWLKVSDKLNADVQGVPFTVVGEEYFIGWLNEATTGASIEKAVTCLLNDGCQDVVQEIISPPTTDPMPNTEPCDCVDKETPTPVEQQSLVSDITQEINVPVLGKVNLKDLSLPLITIVLAGLDGFNPCAMWVLLFLISLLLGLSDKKRRWFLGTAFIIASSLVYFVFMASWLNLLMFAKELSKIQIGIGLVALGGGLYNLKEFSCSKESGCKVTGGAKRQAIFARLRAITQQQQLWLALVGIILLAFAVNLVELICSAGLPVIFTQILAINNLSPWQYYAYMLMYIVIFMLDDLLVFFSAMLTLEMTGFSTKYSRYSHLIGGLVMVIIGLLLIYKPEVLMFG